MRFQRRPPAAELERSAQRAGHLAQGVGVDADGGGEHGHVAGERLEHRQPEALALGGHQHGVGGVDPQRHARRVDRPEGEQLDVDGAGEGQRAVVTLLRARRVGREQQVRRRRGRGRARRAPAAAGAARSARCRPRREAPAPAAAPRGPAAPAPAGPRRRRGGRSAAAPRGWPGACGGGAGRCRARSARARGPGTASAGQAVRPKWAWTTSKRRRGRRRRRKPGAQVAAAPASARRPGGNSYSSTSRSCRLAQRRHLVAHEAPALGVGGVGQHVGDHERAHHGPDRSALE